MGGSSSALIDQLINALQVLPGIGPKSAQRIAFYMLERERVRGQHLAQVIQQAIARVGNCERCRTLSETSLCSLCSNPKRDNSLLCILETPSDVIAIEQTGSFKGYYFVLMGHLSPIDGIGPSELGFEKLVERFNEGELQEVILATNPTVEGEATAHYISELAKRHQIKTSRIAYGVPLGGELEYIDGGTLVRALEGRNLF